jgi:hypothetical protein
MRSRRKKLARNWAIGVAAIVVVALSIWFATDSGNNKRKLEEERKIVLEQEWPEIGGSIQSAIEKFDEIGKSRKIRLEDVEILEAAHRQMTDFRSEYRSMYFEGMWDLNDQIEKRIDHSMAEIYWEQSMEYERTAKNLELKSDESPRNTEEIIKYARLAFEAQKRINDDHSQSQRVNYPRESDLKGWIHYMEAKPLQLRLLETISLADQLFTEEDWEACIPIYQSAIEIQKGINDDYPDAPQANMTRIIRFEDQILEANASMLFIESTDAESRAKTYLDVGNKKQAFAELQNALGIQNRINLDYSNTSKIDPDRAKRLTTQIQTLGAVELISSIEKLNEELDLILSVRLTDKLNYKLEDILDSFELLETDYFLVQNPPLEIKEKAQYLISKQDNLASILEQLDAISIHEESPLTHFIPQKLFELVADTNPSRVTDPTAPVESINHFDIEVFLQRISWITSKEAALPFWEEVAAARGRPDNQPIGEWTASKNDSNNFAIYRSGMGNPEVDSFKEPLYRSRSVSFRIKLLE